MRQRIFTRTALIASVFIFSACARMGAHTDIEKPESSLVAEARAVDQRFMEAFNQKDIDSLMAQYVDSPNTVLYPPAEAEVKGWNNIHNCFEKMFQEHPDARITLINPGYLTQEDGVTVHGNWTMSFKGPDGKKVSLSGRYTETMIKQDGKLRIVIDHASAPLSAPEESIPVIKAKGFQAASKVQHGSHSKNVKTKTKPVAAKKSANKKVAKAHTKH